MTVLRAGDDSSAAKFVSGLVEEHASREGWGLPSNRRGVSPWPGLAPQWLTAIIGEITIGADLRASAVG